MLIVLVLLAMISLFAIPAFVIPFSWELGKYAAGLLSSMFSFMMFLLIFFFMVGSCK